MTEDSARPTCDKPCCTDPAAEDGKPFRRVNWAAAGYTPAEAMAILNENADALPAPRIPPAKLPGDA